MTAIGLGLSPSKTGLFRPRVVLRVPAGRVALIDRDGRYLTDRDGAVLLGEVQ